MDISLDNLNPKQKEAVIHGEGPLLILAGAGTGKTRVITHRIANLIANRVPAGRILAVTFTNKAAGEMRRRIEDLSPGAGSLVWAHTFHAFAARLLRQHHQLLGLNRHFTIYDASDQKRLVAEAMKQIGLESQASKASMYLSLISRAKDDLLDAKSYAIYAAASSDLARQTAARIYEIYQRKIEESGALDFGDLLLKACLLLKEHQAVREYYQEYFIHVLVDEYQDTNHAQYVLTKTLASPRRNLCVVGDDDQSVYSFRGADIRNILEFERDFKDAKVVALEQNYRSTARILDAAGAVIRNNRRRKGKSLWTEAGPGESVAALELADESEEARWTVGTIRDMIARGRKPADISIFYRTNAQSRSFEEALLRAGVAYRIVGAMRFYERKEIKDVLAYARLMLNENDSASLERVINVPPRGLGQTSVDRLKNYAQGQGLGLWESLRRLDQVPGLTPHARKSFSVLAASLEALRGQAAGLPVGQAVLRLLNETGYWQWLEAEAAQDPEAQTRLSNVQELLNAVQEYQEKALAAGEEATLARYLDAVSLQSDLDRADFNESAVTLMTVHLAKGLEFPIVFLTGLEEGLFPIGQSMAQEDLEEERRLCYVGMTRARERLYMIHAATRRIFGHVYANLPSRFLLEAGLLGAANSPRKTEIGAAPRSSAALEAPRRRISSASVGMRVRHPDFGSGLVLDKSGSGESLKVTVRFDNGRTARLLVRYAPLEPA
ncbi:MAG: ATP-dependent helicase [Elusimicrobiota bacterium]